MEITWYGRACFRLRGRDATVICDPCPPATGFVAGKHDVDLLTISHDHADHAYTRSITAGLTLTRPGEYEFRDLLVIGIRTFHDGERGAQRGENLVFAVEIDGVHVCHLGDLGHLLTDEQLAELGPIDVLLVPAGGQFSQSFSARMPQSEGDYWVVVETDVQNSVPEILENNNVGVSPVPIHVVSAYEAEVSTTLETAPANQYPGF